MPSAPVMGDGIVSTTCQLSSVMQAGDLFNGKFVDFGVADDSAFADVASARFELRLDEDDGFSERRARRRRPEQAASVAEMKETSMTSRVSVGSPASASAPGARKRALVRSTEADARIVAELHGDLAEAGVDCGDVRGAALQKAVSKATGGGADVEAGSAGDVDFPVVEGGLKFESAATDVRHVVAEEADGGVGGNGGAGLVDFLFVDEDAASEDESAGTLAARDESALDEQEIDAGFDV